MAKSKSKLRSKRRKRMREGVRVHLNLVLESLQGVMLDDPSWDKLAQDWVDFLKGIKHIYRVEPWIAALNETIREVKR